MSAGRRILCALGVLGATTAGPVARLPAQDVQLASCAALELNRSHWGGEVARRLEALGLADVQQASGLVDPCELGRWLAAAGAGESRLLSQQVGGWARLHEDEFDVGRSGPSITRTALTAELRAASGEALPGRAQFPPDRTGAEAVEGEATAAAYVEIGAAAARIGWAAGNAGISEGRLEVGRLEAGVRTGPLALTVGRGPVAYGYARGGAVVISEAARVDRLQVETPEAFRLPWRLSHLGTFTVSTFLAELSAPRHPDQPYLWGARGTVRPHPRLTFAVNRGAMFGGAGVSITPARLLEMLIGDVTGIGFENQVVSLEGRWRMPTEALLPVTAYFEWGAEDAAGAWWDVPGRIFGLYLPALPGLEHTSVTVEYASFARSCCYNPEWYRHWSFPGSWVIDTQPLGHPLGGHGSEAFVRLESHLMGTRLRVGWDLYTRTRGTENLYVPGREGRSSGIALRGTWRARRGVELNASAAVEDGEAWRDGSLRASGTFFF